MQHTARTPSCDQAPRGLFVSLAPNGFAVELPDPITGHSYTVTFPMTLKGLMVLQKVLREREREVGRIGHPSSPVQQMIEQWLLEDRQKKLNNPEPLLAGIDIGELDL